jgi:hypothetical protein
LTENIKFYFRYMKVGVHTRPRTCTHDIIYTYTHTHTDTDAHAGHRTRWHDEAHCCSGARWTDGNGAAATVYDRGLFDSTACGSARARAPARSCAPARAVRFGSYTVGGGGGWGPRRRFRRVLCNFVPPPVASGCGGGRHRARTAFRSFSIPLGLAAGRRPMGRRPPQWLTTAAAAAFTLFLVQ